MTSHHNFATGNTGWNDHKDRVLKKEWGNLTMVELASRLGFSLSTIYTRSVVLGLRPLRKPRVKPGANDNGK